MRLDLFEAVGFKHVALTSIEKIVIVPEKKFHWILGSNGSGKSALMRQLTVVPANPADYHKGGYKLVHATAADNRKYKLKSDFSGPKNLFNVIRVEADGSETELNPGHTGTVAANLIKQIFHSDKEIHDLTVGLNPFTEMKAEDRKKWLTMLSDVDYTFALQYFKKLSGHYRDILGSIRTDQNRLIELKSRLIGPEEEKMLTDEIELLNIQISGVQSIMPNPTMSRRVMEESVSMIRRELDLSYVNMRKMMSKNKGFFPLPQMADLSESYHNGMAELKFLADTADDVFKRLTANAKKLEDFQVTQGLNLHEQEGLLSSLFQAKNSFADLSHLQGVNDVIVLLHGYESFRTHILTVIDQLTPDLELSYHRSSVPELTAKLDHARRDVLAFEFQRDKLFDQIREMEGHKGHNLIECPKCEFSWNPGYSEAKLTELIAKKDDFVTRIQAASLRKDALQEELDSHIKHFEGIDRLNAVLEEFHIYRPFFVHYMSDKQYRTHPETLSSTLNKFFFELNALKEYREVLLQIQDTEKKIEILKHQEEASVSSLYEEHNRLEEELQSLYDRRDTTTDVTRRQKARLDFAAFLETTSKKALELKERLDTLQVTGMEHMHRDLLSDYLLGLTRQQLEKSKLIREVDIRKNEVQSLEQYIEENQEYVKALRIFVDSLSPKEGLIAKGLIGFINHFTKMMNNLIEKIWLYPLTISAILPDEDNAVELDYKFKVMVKDTAVPDISLCSKGQKEIVNLAFTIVALTFLRLDKGPLFLDEFAANMDVAHRASAYNMISGLLANSNFSQIFMVSHFEDSFSNSLDADITVLCKQNIQIPDGLVYNQNTTIT